MAEVPRLFPWEPDDQGATEAALDRETADDDSEEVVDPAEMSFFMNPPPYPLSCQESSWDSPSNLEYQMRRDEVLRRRHYLLHLCPHNIPPALTLTARLSAPTMTDLPTERRELTIHDKIAIFVLILVLGAILGKLWIWILTSLLCAIVGLFTWDKLFRRH